MYNGLITACDSCAKPLEGRVGTADIKNPYLVIKGNLASVAYDEVMPVATFRRGVLMLCKNCARLDREAAQREIDERKE